MPPQYNPSIHTSAAHTYLFINIIAVFAFYYDYHIIHTSLLNPKNPQYTQTSSLSLSGCLCLALTWIRMRFHRQTLLPPLFIFVCYVHSVCDEHKARYILHRRSSPKFSFIFAFSLRVYIFYYDPEFPVIQSIELFSNALPHRSCPSSLWCAHLHTFWPESFSQTKQKMIAIRAERVRLVASTLKYSNRDTMWNMERCQKPEHRCFFPVTIHVHGKMKKSVLQNAVSQ